MYRFILFCLAMMAIMYIFKCKPGGDFPGREYMPDMAHSRAYDVYTSSPGTGTPILAESGEQQLSYRLFEDGKVARKPAPGTIARGQQPYPYLNDENGYESSVNYSNPYTRNITNGQISKDVLDVGKEKYEIYCGVCHGEKGQGAGSITVAKNGPYAGVPNYFADVYLEMPEGKMFHSVHYGRNDMGSYASQLTKDERWKVISYIKSMQQKHVQNGKGLDKAGALYYVRGQKDRIPRSPATGEYLSSKLASVDKLEKGKKMVLDNVFFSTGSADLRSESFYELSMLGNILAQNPKAAVEISGHTDSDGDEMANLQLSESRAQAVFNYLMDNGVSGRQISFKGYGENRPAAANDTPENKQKNRRVEFEVIR